MGVELRCLYDFNTNCLLENVSTERVKVLYVCRMVLLFFDEIFSIKYKKGKMHLSHTNPSLCQPPLCWQWNELVPNARRLMKLEKMHRGNTTRIWQFNRGHLGNFKGCRLFFLWVSGHTLDRGFSWTLSRSVDSRRLKSGSFRMEMEVTSNWCSQWYTYEVYEVSSNITPVWSFW